jgi:hypothetical protein
MSTPSETISIRVAGDVIVDRHFYDSGVGVFDKSELGGAAGLTRLLQKLIEAKGKPVGATLPVSVALGFEEPRLTDIPLSRNAYAVWAPYRRSSEKGATDVWRAARPMGYGRASEPPETEFQPKRIEGVAPRILVLDDGGFDFRQRARADLWSLPREGEAKPDWIILKTSHPIAQGDLWQELTHKFAERLVCIVSANELRNEYVGIGTGMSWERTIEDLAEALANNPVLKTLDACRHLIVTFSVDGALWIERAGEDPPRATLIFDPARAEGEWGEAGEGKAFGYLSCMAAAIVHAVAEHAAAAKESPDLGCAIGAGLGAMRDLLDHGHGTIGASPNGYPVARLAQLLAQAISHFSIAPIVWPRAAATRGAWMMVSEAPYAPDDARLSVISGLSRQIVINGYRALRGAAHARFGKLVTADRSEIEALRGLRRLMRDYRAEAKADKPLSIGVFGPPGAGKSFGVKQLAEEVFGPKAWLEFNLSQFEGPTDLIGAFHQVRDRVLGGETPVVFWDEFDSRAYFWLQYLLAPMQDGRFQHGQLNHSIGKCVFVFAGGTSFSFGGFKPKSGDAEAEAKFKLAKAPDFKSRLDGYYDVLGPNQRTLPDDPDASDPNDICHPLRRALLIRAKLADGSNDRLDIDPDLLEALLRVERYRHGARSLEKLILALKSPDGRRIRRSSLPPPTRLAMLVEAEKFNAILDRNTGYRMSETIEKLAEWIHEEWRKGDWPKKQYLDVPYAHLPPIDQEGNRGAARRIPDVLALVGLGLATPEEAKSAKKPTAEEIARYIEAHIELLAEAEHDGWMAQRAKNGWSYGAARDDAQKLHPLMMPYRDLPEAEKEKDRDAVRRYPAQANAAGFAILWL